MYMKNVLLSVHSSHKNAFGVRSIFRLISHKNAPTNIASHSSLRRRWPTLSYGIWTSSKAEEYERFLSLNKKLEEIAIKLSHSLFSSCTN